MLSVAGTRGAPSMGGNWNVEEVLASGVPVTSPDGVPAPALFTARRRKVYSVPFTNPNTIAKAPSRAPGSSSSGGTAVHPGG